MRSTTFVAAMAVFLTMFGVPQARAAGGGHRVVVLHDDRIVSYSDRGGDADLIARINLGFEVDGEMQGPSLALSPQRDAVAVALPTAPYECCDLWFASTDGDKVRRLARTASGKPTWSPDGNRIAFPAGRRIKIIRRDGSSIRTIRPRRGFPGALEWSPAGGRLMFQVFDHIEPADLYTVGVDGKNVVRISPRTPRGGTSAGAGWSPNGKKLVYARSDGSSSGLFISTANGRRQRRLTSGNVQAPSWAPNGDRIAFLRGNELSLSTVRRDGTGSKLLWRDALAFNPTWSDESRRISVVKYTRNGERNAFMIRVGDKDRRRLTRTGDVWQAEPGRFP